MRRILRFLLVVPLFGIAFPAVAQVQRPQFRPAVLGTGPDSLVNRIDTKELLQKGQKDGAVMFCAVVKADGQAGSAWTYRGMPNTDALNQELTKRLEGVKFTPAIYNYQPVGVILYGTAIFSATGTPHLRIFLNQDSRELKEASDFIGPQPVFGGDSKFDGLTPPQGRNPVPLTAVVDLGLKINGEGQLLDMRLLAEEPPLLGYGQAALDDFREAKFIPAFRNGDRTECDIVLPVCYKPIE
ncbi:MAG TPA: hypothetical protein VK474_05480 [Chthoniobacterales bacterium]|nr:hypothetical protein [Chthoniobacterales bacterium]